jgi:hypothetical protein
MQAEWAKRFAFHGVSRCRRVPDYVRDAQSRALRAIQDQWEMRRNLLPMGNCVRGSCRATEPNARISLSFDVNLSDASMACVEDDLNHGHSEQTASFPANVKKSMKNLTISEKVCRMDRLSKAGFSGERQCN